MATVDPNRVILVGENPFIRLSETDRAPFSTTPASGGSWPAPRARATCST